MPLSKCLDVAARLGDHERDELLARVERMTSSGMPPEKAQVQAARSMINDLAAERSLVMAAVRDQHPDLLDTKPATEPESEIKGSRDADYDDVLAWAKRAFEKKPQAVKNLVLMHEMPHAAYSMGEQPMSMKAPLVLMDHVAGHIAGRHKADGVTPEHIAQLPQLMRNPRAIIFDKPGEAMAILSARDERGAPMAAIIKRGTLSDGRIEHRITRFASLYPLDDSAKYLVREMKKGTRMWVPSKELSRVVGLLTGPNAPKAGSENPSVAMRLQDGASKPASPGRETPASVFSDDALVKLKAGEPGWQKATTEVEIPSDWQKRLAGLHFSRNDDAPALPASRSQLPGKFKLREFGVGGQVIQAIQDRYNRWKQAVDDVREQGGKVTEANDFYRAEERYWGQVATRNEDFADEIEAFAKAVSEDGLTLGDVAEYAYAQHAQERNEWIAQQRDSMPDGGSGMETAVAQQILQAAQQSGLDPQLEKHADTLRSWIQGTRDILYQGGLITQDEYDAWTNMFTHYVPLRGLDDIKEKQGTGAGFNIKGREGKAAMGRKSQAKQIIEQIVQDRTRALIRVGKNEVLRSFLSFVLDNPSPNLWEVNAVENRPFTTVDPQGNRLIDEDLSIITDERTVTVKDGGQEIHILINDEALRTQMQNLHVESMGKVLGALTWANRKIGAMLTAFNPVFVVLNGARDLQAASVGIIDELGFAGVPRLWASLPKAFAEAARAEFGKASPKFREYMEAGGTTGYFGLKDLDKTGEELTKLVRVSERSKGDPRVWWGSFVKLIEKSNGTVEQTTRFAAFLAARESGETVARAASISKNITVNFNRKGVSAPALGALSLFLNPAVQGTARMIQALRDPRVMAVMGASMTAMFALALRNASMGDDDDGVAWWDKIPKETKDRAIIIMLPPNSTAGEAVPGSKTGRYLKIPMAYGYNSFATLANELADQMRRGQDPARGRDPKESAVNVATSFLGSWLPFDDIGKSVGGDSKSLAMMFVPDAVEPIVAQSPLNMNGFGRKLYTDSQIDQKLPNSVRYSAAQAGTIFQKASEKANQLTGGSKYEPGLIDISPGSLENLVRSYGGGPAAFTLDLMNAFYARQSVERTDPDYRRLPFVKQLYGVIDAETDRAAAFERMDKAAAKAVPFEAAVRNGDGEDAKALLAKNGKLVGIGSTLRDIQGDLSDLRKAELQVISDTKLTDAQRYAKLVELAGKKRLVLQQFNKVYDALLREPK